ncbi:MAG TPA: UrcA family protein [Sphingopyxis sp.]|nr:UrcA family protein [Sphingopyxis sp.]HMP45601.1 UrcA family protein [Sphingopyxis sp.]HMQ17941.1 UrcA family protein [Sphingopyxis sp.]
MAKLTLILLAAPLALTGFSVPAAAQEEKSVVVRYDDLNLSTAPGRERLQWRVASAIRSVCDSRPHYRQTLTQRAQALECEAAARRDADVKLAGLFSGDGTALAGRGQIVVAAP